MNCPRLAVILIGLLCSPAGARSAVVSIGAGKDNTIYQNNVNNSAGGAAGILAGTNGAGSPRRGLLAFDVAAHVPAGATITAALLTMYLGNAPNINNQTIGLHRLNANWGEGTAGSSTPAMGGAGNGFAAAAGDATWNDRMFGSAAWTNPGATGDFSTVASATAIVGGPIDTPHTWLSTPALIGDVQGWLNNPASNFGWALVNANEGTSQTVKAFYSRSATQNSLGGILDPLWRPDLAVTYVIPEPATSVLLALIGPLVFVFRPR